MRYAMCAVLVALIATVGCKAEDAQPKGKSKKTGETGSTESYHPTASKLFADSLVDADGKAVDVKRITAKKYLLVYYSAHWCPPCRAFTPKLVRWYNDNHDTYEVVFVSSDRSADKMLAYMEETKMPWPAVKYGSKALRSTAQFRDGGGVPCLVLLDGDDNRLAGSYDDAGKNYLGPQNAYKKLVELTDEARKKEKEEARAKQ
jgi:nucleoredoxin